MDTKILTFYVRRSSKIDGSMGAANPSNIFNLDVKEYSIEAFDIYRIYSKQSESCCR